MKNLFFFCFVLCVVCCSCSKTESNVDEPTVLTKEFEENTTFGVTGGNCKTILYQGRIGEGVDALDSLRWMKAALFGNVKFYTDVDTIDIDFRKDERLFMAVAFRRIDDGSYLTPPVDVIDTKGNHYLMTGCDELPPVIEPPVQQPGDFEEEEIFKQTKLFQVVGSLVLLSYQKRTGVGMDDALDSLIRIWEAGNQELLREPHHVDIHERRTIEVDFPYDDRIFVAIGVVFRSIKDGRYLLSQYAAIDGKGNYYHRIVYGED